MIPHEVLRPVQQEFHRQHRQRPNGAPRSCRTGAEPRQGAPTLADRLIGRMDADGVALAAIQGLHEIAQEKNARISSLEARIETLETLVEKLVESQAGGE